MALTRLNDARKFTEGGVFVKALYTYNAAYSGRINNFEVTVIADDVVESPTDEQIRAAADAKASTLYNTWTSALDADPVVESLVTGQAGEVIP